MFLKGKTVLVLGLGKTGLSVVNKMLKIADTIIAVDDNPETDIASIKGKGIKIILGPEAKKKESLDDSDIIITSPGIPASHPLIEYGQQINIPIWSELELGWSLLPARERKNTVAVTGTNGKTTAVNLLGHIMSTGKMRVKVCGNVGDPIINTLDMEDTYRVIEVSSFQLERSNSFAPYIGIILNISSDHIDRHGSLEEYGQTKFKLFAYQGKSSFHILNRDDPLISDIASRTSFRSRGINFGLDKAKGLNLWFEKPFIFFQIKNRAGRINIERSQLLGRHNISNIMACVAAAVILGVDDQVIEEAVASFVPLRHRMEYLGTCRGIGCYNDSKATNPHATIAALANFTKPLTLILGGRDKGMDLDDLLVAIDKNVSQLILLGESRKKLEEILTDRDNAFQIHRADSLKQAVKIGLSVTPEGGVLLLSPAFASMDMFKDYKHRGDRFRDLVQEQINDC